MRYYFAPLEGLTDSIYRNLHHKYFPGLDRYYTPFLSPTAHRALTGKEKREIPPADTLNYTVVPQILTKNPFDFLWLTQQCADLGYKEVNLNIGCPSGTVTAKGKGSGMLKEPALLDAFLDEIFHGASLPVSVKTRIGFNTADEFPALLDIFNRYPMAELIIHPRARAQFYSGSVEMQVFEYALENSKNPLCYNGNLCSCTDIDNLSAMHPSIESVMLGRGLIADPGMLCPDNNNAATLQAFHDELLAQYIDTFGSARNAMFRMKENWRHMLCKFEGSEKLGKRLRKTTDINEYRHITQEIFATLPLRSKIAADW
ncbi:MAG: tRNA-dihydrouridine synthase family protein [Oscillospiraceae bacterium]|nr:tRNA-dihydrouridine synthase family protein [Oscillospiraceae bacterium]